MTEIDGPQGYGYATLDPLKEATPETSFFIGSNTKAFTSAAVASLIDDPINCSHLRWDTTVSSLIPDDFILSDSFATKHTTIIDALSHRVGLPSFDLLYFDANTTVKDITRKLRYLNLTKDFRAGFLYCNLMYTVISHVIETLTGVGLGEFMKQKLWRPLNMNATFFSLQDAQASSIPLAKGYIWSEAEQEYDELQYLDLPSISGAGNIISNVLDLSRWVKVMAAQEDPICSASHAALVTPRSIVGPAISDFASPNLYGLGWDLATYHGIDVVWHQGGLRGFGSYVLYLPAKKWGVVALANTQETSNCAEEVLIWHLVDEFLGIPQSQRFKSRTECAT